MSPTPSPEQAELEALRRHIAAVAARAGDTLPPLPDQGLSEESRRVLGALHRRADLNGAAHHRLVSALDAMSQGFAIFDADLRLVHGNRRFMAFFENYSLCCPGVPMQQLVALSARHHLIEMNGRSPDEMCAEMIATPAGGVRVALSDGRVVRWTSRFSDRGDLICIARDISRTVTREKELKLARARAETASRAKSSFLASMSHELRTPMNGVVAMAELLCESGLASEQQLYAETIRSSGEALLSIINDVLDFARGDAGAIRLVERPLDLEAVAADVIVLLRQGAQARGLTLHLSCDPLVAMNFTGDPGRLRQVLVNLVGNAVKFTRTGGVTVRIIGGSLRAGRRKVHILVEDTGIGIPAESLDSIFQEFHQIESAQPEGVAGTGLGLAITRQLVRAMGGDLWVASTPDEGSCFGFTLSLPVDESAVAPLPVSRMSVALGPRLTGPVRTDLARHLRVIGVHVNDHIKEADLVFCADCGALSAFDPAGLPPVVALSDGTHALPSGFAGRLRLPLRRNEIVQALLPHKAPDTLVVPRRMRVIAADDNATNRLVFQKMLRHYDLDLRCAEDGAQAVALWQNFRPDILFMDISMPVMDGRAAAAAIRAAETPESHTPIIAVTAYSEAQELEAIREAGLDEVISKPIRRGVLEDLLRRYTPAGLSPPVPAGDDPSPACDQPAATS
ncbi:MAG: ATP-binding protein [Paracoccus sp. (in: a-proteobacteria)]|nr:ATP-binding protein [Paracoccus sp. (in: a-proteobacteria)]